MTGFVVTLVLGGIAATIVLLFVLLPMFTGSAATGARRASRAVAVEPTDDGARAIDALREIEFDRETGKLSDADYAALKATYTASALDELRRGDLAGAGGGSLSVVAAPRSICPTCGPRPETRRRVLLELCAVSARRVRGLWRPGRRSWRRGIAPGAGTVWWREAVVPGGMTG